MFWSMSTVEQMGCRRCSSGIGVHNAEWRGRIEGILLQQSRTKPKQEQEPRDGRTTTKSVPMEKKKPVAPATQYGGNSGSGVQRNGAVPPALGRCKPLTRSRKKHPGQLPDESWPGICNSLGGCVAIYSGWRAREQATKKQNGWAKRPERAAIALPRRIPESQFEKRKEASCCEDVPGEGSQSSRLVRLVWLCTHITRTCNTMHAPSLFVEVSRAALRASIDHFATTATSNTSVNPTRGPLLFPNMHGVEMWILEMYQNTSTKLNRSWIACVRSNPREQGALLITCKQKSVGKNRWCVTLASQLTAHSSCFLFQSNFCKASWIPLPNGSPARSKKLLSQGHQPSEPTPRAPLLLSELYVGSSYGKAHCSPHRSKHDTRKNPLVVARPEGPHYILVEKEQLGVGLQRARGARLLFQNHTGKSGRSVSWTKSKLSKRTMKPYEYIHVRLFIATRRIYHNYPSAQARPNQIRFVMRTALAFRGLLEVYAFTFCKDNTSNDPCAIIGYRWKFTITEYRLTTSAKVDWDIQKERLYTWYCVCVVTMHDNTSDTNDNVTTKTQSTFYTTHMNIDVWSKCARSSLVCLVPFSSHLIAHHIAWLKFQLCASSHGHHMMSVSLRPWVLQAAWEQSGFGEFQWPLLDASHKWWERHENCVSTWDQSRIQPTLQGRTQKQTCLRRWQLRKNLEPLSEQGKNGRTCHAGVGASAVSLVVQMIVIASRTASVHLQEWNVISCSCRVVSISRVLGRPSETR